MQVHIGKYFFHLLARRLTWVKWLNRSFYRFNQNRIFTSDNKADFTLFSFSFFLLDRVGQLYSYRSMCNYRLFVSLIYSLGFSEIQHVKLSSQTYLKCKFALLDYLWIVVIYFLENIQQVRHPYKRCYILIHHFAGQQGVHALIMAHCSSQTLLEILFCNCLSTF